MMLILNLLLQIFILPADLTINRKLFQEVDTSLTTLTLFHKNGENNHQSHQLSLPNQKTEKKPDFIYLNDNKNLINEFGMIGSYYFSQGSRELNFKNVDVLFNFISGKALIGMDLISTQSSKLKLGMNLSYDYFRLNGKEMFSLIKRSSVSEPNNADANQVIVTYHWRNIEVKSKYLPAVFHSPSTEDITSSDKFSVVVLIKF